MPTMERWSAVALEEEQFNAHCPTQKAKRWQRLLSLIAALPSLSYSDVASPILALVVSLVQHSSVPILEEILCRDLREM